MITKAAVKRLLRPFAFSFAARPHGRRFSIPVIHGIGSSHRHGTEPWMIGALQTLFRISGRAGLVDIGVNIGQTLVKLRSFDEECPYVGFEPSAFCVLYVTELIERNRLRNCKLLPVALSSRPGIAALEKTREGDSGASIVEGLRGKQPDAHVEFIATLRFDELPLDFSGYPVVKIDVEGAELEVLSGMEEFLRRSRPYVLCEVLHAHSDEQLELMKKRNDSLAALLARLDYVILRLRKDSQWATVVGTEPVTAFPDETYRWDSQAVCDYLFAPVEHAPKAALAFATGTPV